MRDNLRPALDVRQPAKHPARRIDDVKRSGELRGQVVKVGTHEGGRQRKFGGKCTRPLDRRGREIGPGHLRAEPRPRQRVEAEVALEMKDRKSTRLNSS